MAMNFLIEYGMVIDYLTRISTTLLNMANITFFKMVMNYLTVGTLLNMANITFLNMVINYLVEYSEYYFLEYGY